jgi:arginine exporter protein ArgO
MGSGFAIAIALIALIGALSIGGLGAEYGEDRVSFAIGAVSASWLWFVALGHGPRLFGLGLKIRRPGRYWMGVSVF